MSTPQQVTIVVGNASSTPVTGSASATGNSAAFTPQLGRPIYLTLSGTWEGSVQVKRSTDNAVVWNSITIGGGDQWGYYTGNCDEEVTTPTDKNGIYRISFTITSGTLNYRIAQ